MKKINFLLIRFLLFIFVIVLKLRVINSTFISFQTNIGIVISNHELNAANLISCDNNFRFNGVGCA